MSSYHCRPLYKICVSLYHLKVVQLVVRSYTKSGRTAADILFNEYFSYFGFPKHIIYDEGEFENKLFKRLEKLAGIKSINIVPYHFMINGIAERINRTIIKYVKNLD